MQPKFKKQNHPCSPPRRKRSQPTVEAETTRAGKRLGKRPDKGGFTQGFEFAGVFYEHCKCLLLTKPLSGCSTEITSLYRSGSLPHLFEQSKSNRQKWKAFRLPRRLHCLCFASLFKRALGLNPSSAHKAEIVLAQRQRSRKVQVHVLSRPPRSVFTFTISFCGGRWLCSVTGCDGFQINPQQIAKITTKIWV